MRGQQATPIATATIGSCSPLPRLFPLVTVGYRARVQSRTRDRKAVCKWTREKKAKGEGSPISIAEVYILKLNLALLKVKGPCSRKVLHLAECSQCIKKFSRPQKQPIQPNASPLTSLTSVSSFSRSNMFSMSMKLVWIILQEG